MTLTPLPAEGIYVVLVYLANKHTMAERIKFNGNRYHLFVSEILESFGIRKLASGERIWIKRNDQTECGDTPFEPTSRLLWTEWDKSVIVISAEKPPQSALINNNAYTPNEPKTFEQNVAEQVKLWQAKKEKKDSRLPRISRAVESRNQAKYIVIKRKRRQRLDAEMRGTDTKTEENKKDPGD